MEDKFAQKAQDWDNPDKMKMTEMFVEEMFKYVTLDKNWKALEIGAGTGLVGMQVLPKVKAMVFEDTSEAMLDVLRRKLTGTKNVEIVHGEVFEYEKKDIDFVFSCMAFHHLSDIPMILSHLAEITKPNATVVIGDLLTEDGSFHRFEPIPHKGFDTNTLSEQFRNAGFEVITAKSYNILHKEKIEGKFTDYTQFILIAKKK